MGFHKWQSASAPGAQKQPWVVFLYILLCKWGPWYLGVTLIVWVLLLDPYLSRQALLQGAQNPPLVGFCYTFIHVSGALGVQGLL